MKKSKTKFVGFVAMSIDGRIAISRNELPNWTSREDWEFFQNALSKVEAVVVGRKTYDLAASRLRKRNTIVLTSRVQSIVRRGSVIFINPKVNDLIDLTKQYKTVAVVGGAKVYQYMIDRGLLNELFVTVEPIIFGYGKDMCERLLKIKKAILISAKKLNKQGTILLKYKL